MTGTKDAQRFRIVNALRLGEREAHQSRLIKPDGSIVENHRQERKRQDQRARRDLVGAAEAKHIQDVPEGGGADRAVIKPDLGKLKVTRTIRPPKEEGGEYTTTPKVVENEEGAAYKAADDASTRWSEVRA